jgi:hypothetical protein
MTEPSSPLAQEAARLLGAVGQWARETFPASGPDGQLAGDCLWCPICQFMAVLRGERPEVTERVSEAGSALLSAMRSLIDGSSTDAGADPARAGARHTHAHAPQPAPPPPRVQHIDLGGSPVSERRA